MKNINYNPKKILFLANHFHTLFAFRKELIQRLLNEGNEVYLSIPHDEHNYFTSLGCHILPTEVDRRSTNLLKDLKLLFKYYKIIHNLRPDIIFSFTIKPNIYGSFVSKNHYKQICNITGTGSTFLEKNLLSEFIKFLYRHSVKQSYKVFFQNSGDKEFFIKNSLINNNYDILPGSGCNIEENPFQVIPQTREVNFIFIGRIMKLKGIKEYLEMAKVIKKKYPNTNFYIAGWGEEKYYVDMVEKYQKAGYVEYLGFRKDIGEFIYKTHCTILPSHGGEGVPNVLLESAARGRVCIGSNIDGIKEVIDDFVTGYLFEVSSTRSLIEKVELFLSSSQNEKNEMGRAGHTKIVDEFDRNIVINKYIQEIYQV